jgi:phage-related protein
MADGRVVINAEIDDDGVSRGIRAIKSKLRELDSGLIRTAALASAITIAPTAVPALAAVTGGVMALTSAFGAAGLGVVGFGAVAIPTLNEIFEANENIRKAEEKLAEATTAKERAKALEELKAATQGLSDAQIKALNAFREFQSFWDNFRSSFETPVLDMFTNSLKVLQQVLILSKPAIQGVAEGINQLLNLLHQSLGTSEVRAFFEYIGSTAKDQIVNFGKIAGNVFLGFMNLMRAFSPLSQDMTNGLVSMTERFREWSASLSESKGFQQFVEYVKENGATLLSILGNVVKTIGALVVALAPVGSAVLQIIDAVTNFIAKLVEALSSSETFKNGVITIFNKVKTVVLQVFGAVRDFVLQKVEEIRTFWQQNGEQIRQAAEKVFNFIKQVVSVTMPIVLGIIKSVWENIKGVISGAIEVILGLIKTFSALLTGDWKGAWEGVKKIVSGAVQVVWNLINTTFIGKVIQGVKTLGTSLVNSVKSMWSSTKTIFNSSVNTVKGIINSGFNFIQNFVSSSVNAAKSAVSNAFSSMKSAVSSTMSNVKSTIVSMWDSAVSFLKGIDLYSIGRNIIQGLVNGISSMAGALLDKARSIANSIKSTIQNALDINSPSRVMIGLGKWVPIGLAEGIDKHIDVVIAATNRMAQAAIPTQIPMNTANVTETHYISRYGNVNINVTIPVNDLEQIRTMNDFFNRLGMKVRQA